MVDENAADAAIIAGLEKLSRDPEESGTFLILEGDVARPYYLQFAPVGDLLLCEAVSNTFLEPGDQLDGEQEAALGALGWRTPDEGGNWTCSFAPGPEAFAAIVVLIHRTFTEVYGLPRDTPLRLQDEGDDEPPDTVPSLRLLTENGDVWDDPSEDGLFLFMGDLDAGNQWLTVQRFAAPFDRFRVSVSAAPEHFDVDIDAGATARGSRGLPARLAHEVLTGWAFALPGWDERVDWTPRRPGG